MKRESKSKTNVRHWSIIVSQTKQLRRCCCHDDEHDVCCPTMRHHSLHLPAVERNRIERMMTMMSMMILVVLLLVVSRIDDYYYCRYCYRRSKGLHRDHDRALQANRHSSMTLSTMMMMSVDAPSIESRERTPRVDEVVQTPIDASSDRILRQADRHRVAPHVCILKVVFVIRFFVFRREKTRLSWKKYLSRFMKPRLVSNSCCSGTQ